MERPTLSPQSNRLLEMCQKVLKGEKKPAELAKLLEEMFAGLEKAQEEFVSQIQSQGDNYAEKIQTEANLVLESFDNYRAGLEKIQSFFDGHDADNIKQGARMIIQATAQVLETLTVYEARELQLGPTSFPIVNMLIRITEGFKNGVVSDKDYRFMIYNAAQYFLKLVDELEDYKGSQALDAINILKEGYNGFIDGLEKLDEAAEAKNDMLLDEAVDIIKNSQETIKSGYSIFNSQMFLSGPTESPHTNILIATINGVVKKMFPKDLLAENLRKYQSHMNRIRKDVEQVSKMQIESQEISEELPRTLKAFEISDQGCNLISQFIETNNGSLLKPAVEKLKESTELLKESQEIFEEIGEREGKVTCVRCGTLNDPSNNSCVNCGSVLPKIPEKSVSSTFEVDDSGSFVVSETPADNVVSENMQKLVNETARLKSGDINFDEYKKTLDWLDDLIKQGLAQVQNAPSINIESLPQSEREKAAEQKKLADEIIQLLKDGLEEFKAGILTLREYGKDKNERHLQAGIQQAWEGAGKLYQVERIGEMVKQPGSAASDPMLATEDTEMEGIYIEGSDSIGTASGYDMQA